MDDQLPDTPENRAAIERLTAFRDKLDDIVRHALDEGVLDVGVIADQLVYLGCLIMLEHQDKTYLPIFARYALKLLEHSYSGDYRNWADAVRSANDLPV